jgi:hypothetical protein
MKYFESSWKELEYTNDKWYLIPLPPKTYCCGMLCWSRLTIEEGGAFPMVLVVFFLFLPVRCTSPYTHFYTIFYNYIDQNLPKQFISLDMWFSIFHFCSIIQFSFFTFYLHSNELVSCIKNPKNLSKFWTTDRPDPA